MNSVEYDYMSGFFTRFVRQVRDLSFRRPDDSILYMGLLALILLNITAGIIAASSLHNLTHARDQARNTNNTNNALTSIYSNLRDAESGQRGYILTGNPAYLSPYYSGRQSVNSWLPKLNAQLDHTNAAGQMTTVTRLSNEKLKELSTTISLRQSQGFNAAVAVIDTNYGFSIMQQIHDALSKIEAQLTANTLARDKQASRFAILAYSSLGASFVFTLTLIYFVRLAFNKMALQSHQLETTNTELMRSNRELQDFASIASHDLQEPLRKIQAFGDRLAATTQLSADSQVYLDRMLDAAGRMRTLIDDLLAFSRVTTKAKPFTRISLNRIAKEVVSDMEVRISETGAQVKVGRMPGIDADATQIRQIFQNLISNALKFQKAGTTPEVNIYSTMERKGANDIVAITVKDNGIGFDQKYTDRIFTIFQRLHGRNEYEGTGIGLAVVRKIAERHGGTVIAESEIGKGSQFVVRLPVTHEHDTN
jgi:signal transduction histidine kinase